MNINKIGILLYLLPDNIIQKVLTKFSLTRLSSILKEEILLKQNKHTLMLKSQKRLSICTKKQECTEKLSELLINMLHILYILSMKITLEVLKFKVNLLMKFFNLLKCGKNQETTLKLLTDILKLMKQCFNLITLKKFGTTALTLLCNLLKIEFKMLS